MNESMLLNRRGGSQRRNSTNLKSLSPLRASISLSLQVRRTSVALRHEGSSALRPSVTPSEENLPPDISAVLKKHLEDRRQTSFQKCLGRLRKVGVDPFLRSHYPTRPANASVWWRVRDTFLCPPIGVCSRWLTGLLAICVSYGLLVVLTKEDAIPKGFCVTRIVNSGATHISYNASSAINSTSDSEGNGSTPSSLNPASSPEFPSTELENPECVGRIFGLYVIFILALVVGNCMKLFHLPPLLGMLMVGLALRNVPYLQVAARIPKSWSAILRNLALCIILTRAGLCLDPATLRRLSAAVFRLAFVPCLVEASVDAVAAHYLLQFPWEWGFMLGFVLGAVSPAVVVLSMLKLEARGYGVTKGVPTLVIAAASMDDVLSITGFSFALGIAFQHQEHVALTMLRGPLEALAGVLYGVIVGAVLWYLPSTHNRNLVFMRSFFLIASGIIILLGSTQLEIPGAGAIGVLTLSLVTGYGWRKHDGWDEENNPVIPIVDNLWWFAQPLLFGLIGAEVDLARLRLATAMMGMYVVLIGLVFRMIASFLVVFGIGLSWSEMFFIPLAWLPKATVQAAIGPVALDTAYQMNQNSTTTIANGNQILTIAALVILTTAPLGAALIAFAGPRMMDKANLDIILESNEAISPKEHPFLADTGNNSDNMPGPSSDLKANSAAGGRGHQSWKNKSLPVPPASSHLPPSYSQRFKQTRSLSEENDPYLVAMAASLTQGSSSTTPKGLPNTPSRGGGAPHLRAGSACTTLSGTNVRIDEDVAEEEGGTDGPDEDYLCTVYTLDGASTRL